MGNPLENALAAAADKERLRIRRAIAPALRELRREASLISWSPGALERLDGHLKTIDRATRRARAKGKRP